MRPLAERMRPKTLDDVIGQAHLLGDGETLRHIVKNKQPVSLILWGPPGTGKTTLARIIATEVEADFIELSAVTAGMADVRKVVDRARLNWQTNDRTLLFVDEIHRFNKSQQDAFLPHVESGLITLIGATTENPSFEVIQPLLSRSRVLTLQPHTEESLKKIILRAAEQENLSKRLAPDAVEMLAKLAGGDARVALGNLELAAEITPDKITSAEVNIAAQKQLPNYDKNGNNHYDTVSAFIKSMRGSDVNATLYYLARMLQSGEDPKIIARRMIIFASEDIGLAGNGAMSLAVAAFQAVERIGMPECEYNLYHCAIALAKSKKSRYVANAKFGTQKIAHDFPNLPIPNHLRNTPTSITKELGYQKGYKWEANFKHPEGFLPPELKNWSV